MFEVLNKKTDPIKKANLILSTDSRIKGPEYWQGPIKPKFDRFVASLFLCGTSPAFLLTSLAVLIGEGGWPITVSIPCQYADKHYNLTKFRTLPKGTPVDLEEPRLMSIQKQKNQNLPSGANWTGKMLKKISWNELPNLINVREKKISMVGHRPRIESAWKYLERKFSGQDILDQHIDNCQKGLKPGVTGLYVVCGRDRNDDSVVLELDNMYAEKASLKADLKIIALTTLAMFQYPGK